MKHNDDLVLDIIKNNTKSLTAYEILSKVQRLKKIQPMSPVSHVLRSNLRNTLVSFRSQDVRGGGRRGRRVIRLS